MKNIKHLEKLIIKQYIGSIITFLILSMIGLWAYITRSGIILLIGSIFFFSLALKLLFDYNNTKKLFNDFCSTLGNDKIAEYLLFDDVLVSKENIIYFDGSNSFQIKIKEIKNIVNKREKIKKKHPKSYCIIVGTNNGINATLKLISEEHYIDLVSYLISTNKSIKLVDKLKTKKISFEELVKTYK